MLFKIGDLVTRNSYNNDTVFRITQIDEKMAYLKGLDIRLYADSLLDDLKLATDNQTKNSDFELIDQINRNITLDRNEYFYLPGKVLHIDGDDEYLSRCLNFYKKMKIKAFGVLIKEENIALEIFQYLTELKPDIVIITGHDVFYKKSNNKSDINNYRNSRFFAEAIKKAREYEKSHDKLIIIAGACQSDYENLIKSGANFASSPKRVNIHALDPAIIASSIALSARNKPIDIIDIISRTKYKEEGIGGIITNGMMYTGYPR